MQVGEKKAEKPIYSLVHQNGLTLDHDGDIPVGRRHTLKVPLLYLLEAFSFCSLWQELGRDEYGREDKMWEQLEGDEVMAIFKGDQQCQNCGHDWTIPALPLYTSM